MFALLIGVLAAAVLIAIGVLHIVWLRTSWPWNSPAELNSAVFGSSEATPPPAILYWATGAALVAAGVLVLMQAGAVPALTPEWLRGIAMWALAGVLLLRGVGGYFMNSNASAEFVRLNSYVYSPLCIALAALVVIVQLVR
ncbi:MAG: DUF3995 domain-containing protein [Rhodococcus sp. (in: high G+C Gram-positive bacteria)]